MDIAIAKAKIAKGCKEGDEPLYSMAKSYLRYCKNNFEPTDGLNGPWCAAFMNWCIGQTTNPNTKLPSKHLPSAGSQTPVSDKIHYSKVDKPYYGCIVVYSDGKGHGHTGFLAGMTKAGKYILLGGNQDNTIRFDSYGEYTSKSKKKKLNGFYLPSDYVPSERDEVTEADIYESALDLDKSIGIYSTKSNKSTN